MSELLYGLLSVVITVVFYFISRHLINKKLQDLHGSDKLLGLISIGIIVGELVYLGTNFGLFNLALEVIASIGAAAVVLGIALQNQLRNTISGISIFLNSQINVGDTIEFDYVKAKITGLHLTKTIAITEDGTKMIVPNHKFSEEMILIFPKN